MERGKFVVLEGIDGCGKTTQSLMLLDFLNSQGLRATTTSEPSEGAIGKLIRGIQLGENITNPTPETMIHLYAADRAEHFKEIKKLLDSGIWVICDRYLFSSIAYQGITSDLYDDAYNANYRFPCPDVTVWLTLPPDAAYARIAERGKQKEIFEDLENLRKVHENYKTVFLNYFDTDLDSDKFIRVNAEDSPENVCSNIVKALQERKIL